MEFASRGSGAGKVLTIRSGRARAAAFAAAGSRTVGRLHRRGLQWRMTEGMVLEEAVRSAGSVSGALSRSKARPARDMGGQS
nr:hypothetical protein GCM10020092_023680 [Actinoplanes digitatis]